MVFYQIGSLFSEPLRRRIQRKLVEAGIMVTSEEYIGVVALLSLVVSTILLTFDAILSVIAFFVLFSLGIYLPNLLSSLRSKNALEELPFFLKSIDTFLSAGFTLKQSIYVAAVGRGVIEDSAKRIMKLNDSGIPFYQAVKIEGSTYSDERVRQVFNLLSDISRTGSKGDVLKRLSENMLISRKLETKEKMSRVSVTTLFFIAITALIPSMLIMYMSLYPVVFGTAVDIGLLYFVLFFAAPLTAIGVLVYSGV